MAPPKRKLPAPTRSGPVAGTGVAAPDRSPARTERPRRPDLAVSLDRQFALELTAWIAVAAVALAIRLLNVDGNPLQPTEGVLAMDSWRIVHQQGIVIGPAPLLVYLNAFLFLMLGATDAVARGISVWAGWLVAVSPFLLRRRIGRVGALGAATILAVSPSLVFASRSVDPSMLAIGLGLAVVLGVTDYLEQHRGAGLYCAAAAAALLAIAGPLADLFIIIGAIFVALAMSRIWRQSRRTAADSTTWGLDWLPIPRSLVMNEVVPSPETLKWVAVAFGLTFIPIATGLGTHLEGLGDSLAGPIAVAAASFGSLSVHPYWLYPTLLVGYEPFALVFGVIGGVLGFRHARLFDVFLSWWAAAGFVLLVFTDGRNPIWVVLLVVPLGLLGGRAIDAVVTALRDQVELRRFFVFGAFVLPLIATTLIALGNVTLTQPNVPDWVGAVPPLLIVTFVIGFALWYDWPSAYRSMAGVAVVALLGFSVHAAMLLNPGRELNPAEYFTGTVTSSDVRTLTSDSATILDELRIAQQLEGRNVNTTVDLAPSFAQPLGWYLTRPDNVNYDGQYNVQVADASGDSPGIAVLAANAKAPNGPYAGELFEYSLTAPMPSVTFASLWRWWIYHQTAEPQSTFVKVFVKTQLARP